MFKQQLITILSILLIGTTLHAQTETKVTTKQLSDLVCDCMKDKKVEYTTKEIANEQFVACFSSAPILTKLFAYIKEQGKNVDDSAEMEKIGEAVGIQLVQDNCTPFMKIVEGQVRKEMEKDDEEPEVITISGKLVRTEIKEFVSMVILGKNNREITVMWIQPFTGSEKFKGDNLEKMKNKNLTVKYQLKEAYLPKVGDYFQIKEIVGIEEN
jgi:hypothetical protein